MHRFNPLPLVICLLPLVLLAGCATFPKNESSSSDELERNKTVLAVAPILKFDDIPVPAGFKCLDKESFAFQNDKSRVALLKYYGGQSADSVVAFYKEEMSISNWDLVNIIEYDRKVLNYENGDESCIITVQPQGGKSTVIISLSPRSRPIKAQKVETK